MSRPPSAWCRFKGVEPNQSTRTRTSSVDGAMVSTWCISRGARGATITTAGCFGGTVVAILVPSSPDWIS